MYELRQVSIEKESYVPGINCRNVTYLGLVEMIVHIESGENVVRELFRSTQWSLVGNFFVGDRDKKDFNFEAMSSGQKADTTTLWVIRSKQIAMTNVNDNNR